MCHSTVHLKCVFVTLVKLLQCSQRFVCQFQFKSFATDGQSFETVESLSKNMDLDWKRESESGGVAIITVALSKSAA